MTLAQFGGLLVVYLLALVLLLNLPGIQAVRFNFNVFFSVLYLLTFYLGFPFTCLLVYRYGVEVVAGGKPLESLLAATDFYGNLLMFNYRIRLFACPRGTRPPWFQHQPCRDLFTMAVTGSHRRGNGDSVFHP